MGNSPSSKDKKEHSENGKAKIFSLNLAGLLTFYIYLVFFFSN